VVLLGDSFTFGDEVGDSDTWAAKLAAELPHARVTNRGVLGYGLDQMWITARADLQVLQPEILVVGVTSISVWRLENRWGAWRKPRVELQGDELTVVDTPVPTPDEVIQADRFRSRALDVLLLWWERMMPNRSTWSELSVVTTQLFTEMDAVAEKHGAQVMWVYLPQQEEFLDRPRPLRVRELLSSYCAETSSECLDLTDTFREATSSGAPLSRGAHWAPAGHDLVSDAVAPTLRAMLD